MPDIHLNDLLIPDIGWLDAAVRLAGAAGPFFYLKGWGRNPVLDAPGELIYLLDDRDRVIARATTGEMRADVGAALGDPRLGLGGWTATVPLATVPHDSRELRAYVVDPETAEAFLLNGSCPLVRNPQGEPSPAMHNNLPMPTRAGHILIHSCGKVGSTAICQALAAANPGCEVLQVHAIAPRATANMEKARDLAGMTADGTLNIDYSLRLATRCREILAGPEPVMVATGFRDPLDYALSAFFEHLPLMYPQLTYRAEAEEAECSFLLERFLLAFESVLTGRTSTSYDQVVASGRIRGVAAWFEREFAEVYGFSVYDHPAGDLTVFQRDGRTFILYRYETLRDNFAAIASLLCPGRAVSPVTANEASAKPCASLYRLFRQRLELSSAMAEYLYDSRYFRHFYQTADIRVDLARVIHPGGTAARVAEGQ